MVSLANPSAQFLHQGPPSSPAPSQELNPIFSPVTHFLPPLHARLFAGGFGLVRSIFQYLHCFALYIQCTRFFSIILMCLVSMLGIAPTMVGVHTGDVDRHGGGGR